MLRGLMFLRLIPAVLALGTMCFADTITLKNGGVIQGTYLGGDARHVKIAVGDRIDTYSVDELSNIRFGGSVPQPPPQSTYTRGPDGLERRTDGPPPAQYENPPTPASSAGI